MRLYTMSFQLLSYSKTWIRCKDPFVMFILVDNTTTDSKCIKSHPNFLAKFFWLGLVLWTYWDILTGQNNCLFPRMSVINLYLSYPCNNSVIITWYLENSMHRFHGLLVWLWSFCGHHRLFFVQFPQVHLAWAEGKENTLRAKFASAYSWTCIKWNHIKQSPCIKRSIVKVPNFLFIKQSPLLSCHVPLRVSPNSLFLFSSTCIEWSLATQIKLNIIFQVKFSPHFSPKINFWSIFEIFFVH